MSRQYMNDRWCVRCGRNTPTPYVRDNLPLFKNIDENQFNITVLDVGCGNGRNTVFLRHHGFEHVSALDMAGDFGAKCELGKDRIPFCGKHFNVVLCNYVFMFLSEKERAFLIKEIRRVAARNALIVVELYPAKDSFTKTKAECLALQKDLFDKLRGEKVKYSQMRFITRLP